MNEFDRQLRKFRRAANATPEEIERMSERARHVTETVTLQTYTLELVGPRSSEKPTKVWMDAALRLARGILETEENLTDLLPDGYSVRIREWDSPGEGYEPAGMH